jgi:predicted nucleotidyltransferase
MGACTKLREMDRRLSGLESVALADFTVGVRTVFGNRVVRIALFGSRARGEGRDDSDLDVLVLVRHLSRAERRFVQDRAFGVGLARRLVLSPLVVDEATWRDDLPLGRIIAKEGMAL